MSTLIFAQQQKSFFVTGMMNKKILLLLTILATSVCLWAQDTLPKFSAKYVGNNKIIISWTNNYELVKQISVQRSADSLKNYKTIVTVPDPANKRNGFTDTKAPNNRMFYRIFIMLDKGMFVFSDAKRPAIDTFVVTTQPQQTLISVEKQLTKEDSILLATPNSSLDSVAIARKEELMRIDPFSLELNRPQSAAFDTQLKTDINGNRKKPDIFVASLYVYTARDGNVHFNLPDVTEKKYAIKFYDEKDEFLFEIKELKDAALIIDKTNFYHAGWFKFELYVNDKLKEKNKFYIGKEF